MKVCEGIEIHEIGGKNVVVSSLKVLEMDEEDVTYNHGVSIIEKMVQAHADNGILDEKYILGLKKVIKDIKR